MLVCSEPALHGFGKVEMLVFPFCNCCGESTQQFAAQTSLMLCQFKAGLFDWDVD